MDYLPQEIKIRHELYRLLTEKLRRKLPIGLFAKQEDVINCKDRRIVINAGRRAGKTECLCYILAEDAINYPNRNLLYIAKSMDSARNIVWNKLVRMLEGKPGVKFNAHEYRIIFDNKSVIRLGGADKDPDVHRGQAYHKVVVDEAAFIRDLDYILQEVLEPALLDYEGTLYVASSPYGMNKFYDLCDPTKSKGWTRFYWNGYDNPFLPKRELDRIRLQYGADSIVWRQEYLGEFIRHDGLIFKNFRTEPPYVIPHFPIPRNLQRLLIIDPGTAAPTGFVKLAYNNMVDRLYVTAAQNLKTRGNMNALARKLQMEYAEDPALIMLCDGHATHVIAELQTTYGLPIIPWTKKDVMGSYARLISRLERGSMQLFAKECEDLEKEILDAEWKPTRDVNDESGKVLGSDHCLDALRYGNEYLYHRNMEKAEPNDGLTPAERRLMEKLKQEKEESNWDNE